MRIKVFSVGLAGIVLLLLASTAAAGVVNNVFPNGSDDTVNIENAFLSCISSGPNCTVKLAAGTFYISRPIVIANFDGTFRGKGKHKTIIENLHNVPFPVMTTGPGSGLPGMFYFYREPGTAPNSIRFSDFSLRAFGEGELWSSHHPSNQWNTMFGIHVAGVASGIEDFEVSSVDVAVERVSFQGEKGNFLGSDFNLFYGFVIAGEEVFELDETVLTKYFKEIVGSYTVKDSNFTNLSIPFLFAALRDSTVVIGGKPKDGNTFDQIETGVWFLDLNNTTAVVSFNKGTDIGTDFYGSSVQVSSALTAVFGADFGPVPELFPEPSSYSIHQNRFRLIGASDGFVLYDFSALVGLDATLNAVVAGNRLTLDTLYGGIFGYAAQNVLALGNHISGTGESGIAFGLYGDPSSHWIIAGNDVDDLEAEVAPIWLGPDTSENLVITRNPDENVLDEGTDNVIIGR